jgi:uncharacterized protein
MYLYLLITFLSLVFGSMAEDASFSSKTEYEQANAYEKGDSVSQDLSKAFDLFLECAKRGDPRAEYKVGNAYFNGVGVSKDQVEGLAWMYNAVNSGISSGVCSSMEESLGSEATTKAKARAKELSLKQLPSVECGLIKDQKSTNSGDSGDMSPADFERMALAIKNNAINNNVITQKSDNILNLDAAQINNLAMKYNVGDGVPKNQATAVRYFKIAANRSYPPALFNLAQLYKNGKGVAQNSKTAFSLFYRAASAGYAPSQNPLGVAYALGQGIPKDLVRAYMWFNIAAANGSKDAAKNRELAAQQMTPNQIEEAQRLSSEWTPELRSSP